jgi:hypothetical protein
MRRDQALQHSDAATPPATGGCVGLLQPDRLAIVRSLYDRIAKAAEGRGLGWVRVLRPGSAWSRGELVSWRLAALRQVPGEHCRGMF